MAEVLRDFQCKMCSKLLGSRAALQRHSKEVHSRNSAVVSCPRCQKLFQNRSNLKIHMLTHSGVRPFKFVHITINCMKQHKYQTLFLDVPKENVLLHSRLSNVFSFTTRKCTATLKNKCQKLKEVWLIHSMLIQEA